MFLVILSTVIVIITTCSWIYFLFDSKKQSVKGPLPFPIVGNGHLFLVDSANFLQLLSRLAIQFSDAYRVYILLRRYVILSHPKYIEDIMSSTEIITKGQSYYFLQPWLGQGLLTSMGHRWKTHRKFLTPAFHYNILHSFLPVFLKNEKILCRQLARRANASPIDLFPIFALAALDNVTESIMGVSFHTQEDMESEYVKAIDTVSHITSTRMRNLFLGNDTIFEYSPQKKKYDEALSILHGHTKNVIEARRKELDNSEDINIKDFSDTGMKNKHAFLDLLLLTEVDGKPLDDVSIREEVDTFMFEGHDTTTSGMVFALYCMAKHEDVQRKILKEQKAILNGDLNRDPTYSELKQMKYLECVIKESLRLYPSVPLIERMITDDVVMSGMRLYKNTSVLVNIFHMHRHPDLIEDPLRRRFEEI